MRFCYSYVTASASFPLMAVLFAMGIFQEGALEGISYYILEPKWSKLQDRTVDFIVLRNNQR